jgi:DNA repair protein RadD
VKENREYQRLAVLALARLLVEFRSVCGVAPTGSGKTVIAAMLLTAYPRNGFRKMRVLWVAHRIELLKQAYDQLRAAGVPASELGLFSGPKKINLGARILVAGIDSMRSADFGKFDLIVVDECHRIEATSYQALIEDQPQAMLLGLTATPWRLDGKSLNGTFAKLHVMAKVTELIVDGYIAKPHTYGVPQEKAREMVRGVRSMAGDYAPGQLGKAMMRGTLMGDVVSECARLAPGLRTLVFAATREHGKALTTRFKHAKRSVEYLDGETPSGERAAMLRRLASGETEVVVNVDVLTEGFDCPSVKCIVMARPTKSLTRFLQYCGRASRKHGNKRPIILDHAGNCHRRGFGLPCDERDWDGLWVRPDNDDGGGDSPVKQCSACGEMIHAAARECPECGAEQPVEKRELEEQAAKLELLQARKAESERRLGVLRQIAKARGLGEAWVKEAAEVVCG